MTQEQLRKYKEYGQSILDTLDSVKLLLPDWVPDSLTNSLEAIRKAAKTTVERASEPVKIGIMGEFSSGKTLLIGSVIGYADALPVSARPTTGNVTAIHLLQHEQLQTTTTEQFQVRYLSHQEFKDCLGFMLEEGKKRAQAAGLPPAMVTSLTDLYPTTGVDANGLLRWCQQAWDSSQNSELRYLLRELVVFVRTYSVCGHDICGKIYQVDPATAKEGLTLPKTAMNILGLSFDNLPNPSLSWQNLAQPSAGDLENSFSLIRRIDVTVKVAKEIWDLSSLQGTNEFILLDFPGLGAAASGVRDTFLSLRELAEVQTILLLLNGMSSGSGTAAKIRTTIEQDKGQDIRDRVIVGVGRFNQLPLSGKDEEAIDELLNSPFLSEETVLEKLDILRDTIASAGNLTTEKNNIVLLSQLYGLTKIAELSRLVQVSSPEFSPELDRGKLPEESKRREKWEQLSNMLPGSSTLKKQLHDFVNDGGISNLRSLLKEHVALHGMEQLVEDTRKAAEALQQEQNNLKNILETIPDYQPIVESEAFLTLREGIQQVLNIYQQFKQDLDLKPSLQLKGVDLSDVVKGEINKRINDWAEWNKLFNQIKEGIITTTSEEINAADLLFGDDWDTDDHSIPTKSDDFDERFETTFKELEEFIRIEINNALAELLKKLSSELKPQQNKLTANISSQMQEQIEQKFGAKSKEAKLLSFLTKALEPNQWSDAIVQACQLTENHPPNIYSKALFPLASRDENHIAGQSFDWNPEKKFINPPKPLNHQILVLRLRDEMIAIASFHLVEYVSLVTKKINQEVLGIVKASYEKTLTLSRKEALLRYMAEEEQGGSKQTPPWLQTLSLIPSIK